MIHPSAVVSSKAELASDVEVGPYCVIGKNVQIDSGTKLQSHIVVNGPCRIGKNNAIYSFACIGGDPQDKKFHGEQTQLEIGDNNLIREYVTINRGTDDGGGITKVGNDNWIMAYVHIAHDCFVGNNTIFSNAASLAGHVEVGNHAILSGFTLVSQFVRIGAYSFSTMGSAINRDVPPCVLVSGNMAKPKGINIEGLKRNQFSASAISDIKKAYRLLYKSGSKFEDAITAIEALANEANQLSSFVKFLKNSDKSIIR